MTEMRLFIIASDGRSCEGGLVRARTAGEAMAIAAEYSGLPVDRLDARTTRIAGHAGVVLWADDQVDIELEDGMVALDGEPAE